ncbi:hypothetical protein F5Y10DRAFT_287721 [Nemania abortiva]|nr:hypothetical protein F5Y10DRAFT_287721 [Nemania abortiva]
MASPQGGVSPEAETGIAVPGSPNYNAHDGTRDIISDEKYWRIELSVLLSHRTNQQGIIGKLFALPFQPRHPTQAEAWEILTVSLREKLLEMGMSTEGLDHARVRYYAGHRMYAEIERRYLQARSEATMAQISPGSSPESQIAQDRPGPNPEKIERAFSLASLPIRIKEPTPQQDQQASRPSSQLQEQDKPREASRSEKEPNFLQERKSSSCDGNISRENRVVAARVVRRRVRWRFQPTPSGKWQLKKFVGNDNI